MTPTANHATSPRSSLLLLPAPPRPLSDINLAAAYRQPLTAALSKLKISPVPSTLVVAATCTILEGPSRYRKSVLWHDAQSLLAGLYKLVAVICDEESIDAYVGAGPGSVDVRIILVDHEPSRKYSTNFDGEYDANCTSVPDLAVFASRVSSWANVFYPSSEAGYALFRAYLGIASTKSSFSYQQLAAVEGGITMIAEDSKDSEIGAILRGIVCLGGTFDHLHPGHKLLLHATTLLLDVPDKESDETCTVIVGISGDELLVNKKNSEQLQAWDERAQNVLVFLSTVLEYRADGSIPPTASELDELVATFEDGKIKVRCVKIHDGFGPTITEEDMDVLVVSGETVSGGKAINDRRVEKSWKPLEVYTIDVLQPQDQDGAETEDFSAKISSTKIREQIAKESR